MSELFGARGTGKASGAGGVDRQYAVVSNDGMGAASGSGGTGFVAHGFGDAGALLDYYHPVRDGSGKSKNNASWGQTP